MCQTSAQRCESSLSHNFVEVLVTKAVDLALEGDMAAIGLVLERLVPADKGEAQPFALDALRNADGLTEQGKAVIGAIAGDDIAASDGAVFIGALTQVAKLIATEELEKRIAAPESGRAE